MNDDLSFKVNLNHNNTESYSSLGQENQELLADNKKDSFKLSLSESSYDLSKAAHPRACISTFIFKLLAYSR